MIYEFKVKKLKYSTKDPKCVFCKTPVGWGDYFLMCNICGDRYFKIPKVFRMIFPKFVLRNFKGNKNDNRR